MSVLSPLSISGIIKDIEADGTLRDWKPVLNVLLEFIHIGSGTPEASEVGSVGHIFLRTDGGAKTCIYVKESGSNTNTGWIAVRT